MEGLGSSDDIKTPADNGLRYLVINRVLTNEEIAWAKSMLSRICTEQFDPAKLFAGTEGGFWDGFDVPTLWQDEERTIPVAKDGDPVRCVDDKSGNGNHLRGGPWVYRKGWGVISPEMQDAISKSEQILTPPYKRVIHRKQISRVPNRACG